MLIEYKFKPDYNITSCVMQFQCYAMEFMNIKSRSWSTASPSVRPNFIKFILSSCEQLIFS